MSFEIQIISDLAILMVIASVVAFIFYKLKQPLIIGYLIAGIIIGPYTPPFNLITHVDFLNVFAEIGVILLLFTVGLEFPIRKLRVIGRVVIGVSAIEITMMLLVSYVVGTFLQWGFYDTLFLGAALASSSTTIIAKVLSDMGKIKEISSLIMLGILVAEDVVVVILLAMMSKLRHQTDTIIHHLIPLTYSKTHYLHRRNPCYRQTHRSQSNRPRSPNSKPRLLYILMLGVCFAFAIVSNQIGFSAAIGAFLIGVVIRRSRSREEINRKIGPFKLVFGAIFFVSMGALMDITR